MLAKSYKQLDFSSFWKSSSHFKDAFFHPYADNIQECNCACLFVCPFQLTSSTFSQCLRASQIYTSKPELTVFSDNAAFQFAWFWHRTESLCLNQDFQRGGHGAPLSQSMERCGDCGGSHLPDRHSEELDRGPKCTAVTADDETRGGSHAGREELLSWLPF